MLTILQLVRDCLAFLLSGAGLEHGKRPRKHSVDHADLFNPAVNKARYIFTTEGSSSASSTNYDSMHFPHAIIDERVISSDRNDYVVTQPFLKLNDANWESLPPLRHSLPAVLPQSGCDINNPRIFHMYWTGAFNDKPYLSLISFLYTQNIGLSSASDPTACRPQLHFWINPGPAYALVSDMTVEEMFDHLANNQWSSPFLQ